MVYALIDPITKQIRYIGWTNSFSEARLKRHLYETKYGATSHKCNWIRSLVNNGLLPIIQVIVPDGNQIDEIHQICIHKCLGYDLTNSTIGGDGAAGFPLSDEHKEKLSKACLGRIPSSETRLKMSLNNAMNKDEFRKKLCKPHGDKWNEKIAISNRGKKRTEETKRKIGETSKGRIPSVETRRKISQSLKYKVNGSLTEERKQNIAKAMRGKVASEAVRTKMSNSHKLYQEKKRYIEAMGNY